MNAPRQPAHALRALLERLSPKQRQYAMLGAIVAGVSIEQHNLRPGESTSVYVIRRGEAP